MLDVEISGAGGGGGKSGGSGGGLNEQPDSLRSTSYAQVLDLISEGEIVGLVDGAKSIYVDDTPVQNADGTYNFQNVQYVTTTGTQSQAAINGFDTVRNEIAVATEAKFGVPVTRSITNTNVSSVAVTVQFPQLTYLDNKGNLGGTSVQYAIDVQNNGGGFVEVLNLTVTGKSTSTYERQHRIKLPAGGPWDIRLRRITADSTSSSLNNKSFLKSYTEIVEAKLRYPNSALVGVRVDASQFRSVPRRGYDVKLLKIRIPTNATVRADGSLSYAGSWDGTFKIAWSTCPAWCMYDMLTANRYGLGDYIPAAMIDKWSLYTISKYCNELVSDGLGGTEPRFSCNIYVETAQEAYKLINDMASIFRAMPYWSAGAITLAQDSPQNPEYLFHNGNVIDGQFTYQGSSTKARHTVALVTWNDPSDMYRQKVEYVEDTAGIARYGVIETQVVAVGCTSRGQAHRVGRWILYSERYETDVVTFKTGKEGLFVAPGNVIKIADQYRAGQRMGGRVVGCTGKDIILDSLATPPTLPATIYIAGSDGTVASYSIQSITGNVVTTTALVTNPPPKSAPWVIASTALDAQTFRVVTVAEGEDGNYEINAVSHNPSKYGYIESGLTLQTRNYTSLSPVPDAVGTVTLSESLYAYQNQIRAKISASWGAASNATAYRVRWRYNSGNWSEATTSALDFEILNTAVGLYEVQVTAIGVFGTPAKSSSSASINALGKTAPPADVTGFTATLDPKLGITLSWSSVLDLDLAQYEIRVGASWAAGSILTRVTANSYKVGFISAGSQTYWIKAVDTSGNYSTNAATVSTTMSFPTAPTSPTASVIDNNVLLKWSESTATLAIDVYEIRKGSTFATAQVVGAAKSTFTPLFETAAGTYTYWIVAKDIAGNYGTPVSIAATINQPPDYQLLLNFQSAFAGTKSNAIVDGGKLYVPVNITETFQAHFTTNSWASPQDQINAGYPIFIQPTPSSGYYEEVIDYGATVAACKVSAVPTYVVETGTATLTPTISVSNTSATGPWTDFAGVSEVYTSNFRWVKVRYDVAASSGGLISFSAIAVKLDAKQKSDMGSLTCSASDVGGTVVNFNQSFVSVSSIQITPLTTSPVFAVYDFSGGVNPTSFKILLFNTSGTRVSGTVSWTARGY